MSDKADKLYNILQNDQHYKDILPDKNTFVDKLQNREFADKFHDILLNDNRYNEVIPDPDSFYRSMVKPIKKAPYRSEQLIPESKQETTTPSGKINFDFSSVSNRPKTAIEAAAIKDLSIIPINKEEESISKVDIPKRLYNRDQIEKWNFNRQLGDIGLTEDEFKKKGGAYDVFHDKIYYPENKGFEIDNIIENINRRPLLSDLNEDSIIWGNPNIRNKYKDQLGYGFPAYQRKMEIKGIPFEERRGLDDKDFVNLMLSQREDPELGASKKGNIGKISDEDIISLMIDRQKRKASGYFDTKYNMPSNVHSETLNSMNKETCNNCFKKEFSMQKPEFDKYNKQAIIETYKVLNPDKKITPELEKYIDDKLSKLKNNK